MYTCQTCKQPITDGQGIVIVTDASLFNDGEIEHGDTWHYHAEHVVVRSYTSDNDDINIIRRAATCFLHSEDPDDLDLTALALALGEDPNNVEAIPAGPTTTRPIVDVTESGPIVMREYDYTYSADDEQPQYYENQPHQHDLDTATTWVMHAALRPEHLDEVLTTVQFLGWTGIDITGEYTYGDSFIEWASPTDDDDDRHLAIYFNAPNKTQALEDGRFLSGVTIRKGPDGQPRVSPFHVSTAGDYAEQIPQR